MQLKNGQITSPYKIKLKFFRISFSIARNFGNVQENQDDTCLSAKNYIENPF